MSHIITIRITEGPLDGKPDPALPQRLRNIGSLAFDEVRQGDTREYTCSCYNGSACPFLMYYVREMGKIRSMHMKEADE